jgi:UDP-glucose 4-epimerase
MAPNLYEFDLQDSNKQSVADWYLAQAEANPIQCFRNNVETTLNLLELAVDHGTQTFIYLSSSAIYGATDIKNIKETHPLKPHNNYGLSKRQCEEQISRVASTHKNLNYGIIRCFTIVGRSDQDDWLQVSANHMDPIRIAAQVVTQTRSKFSIFGDQFQTSDGTCVRDYLHVDDLANLVQNLISFIQDNRKNVVCNGGTGKGHSIMQIIQTMEKITENELPHVIEAARQNEYPSQIACMTHLSTLFSWKPLKSDLIDLCHEAIRFEKKLQNV